MASTNKTLISIRTERLISFLHDYYRFNSGSLSAFSEKDYIRAIDDDATTELLYLFKDRIEIGLIAIKIYVNDNNVTIIPADNRMPIVSLKFNDPNGVDEAINKNLISKSITTLSLAECNKIIGKFEHDIKEMRLGLITNRLGFWKSADPGEATIYTIIANHIMAEPGVSPCLVLKQFIGDRLIETWSVMSSRRVPNPDIDTMLSLIPSYNVFHYDNNDTNNLNFFDAIKIPINELSI